ncbi:MAG: HAD family hydrolase [Streptosporangiaceae bacterium]
MPDAGIDAVVFDIGGVLLDWDPRHLYRKLFDDPAEMNEFLDRICTPRWHLSHDLGADIEASCRSLAARHPGHADLIMAWWRRGEEMIAGQIDGTVTILADLKAAGIRCYALSNMEADRFAVRRHRYPFFELFDGWVISGIEGVAKPDPAIFDLLLTRYGLSPERTAFIDDSGPNVRAAAGLGLIAVEFSSPDRLRRDLRDLGLAVAVGQV